MHQPDDSPISQNSLDHFPEFLDDAPCGVAFADLEGRFLKVNRTLSNWTGKDASVLENGERLQALLTTGHRIYYETHIAPMLTLQGYVREIACKLDRDGQEPLPVLLNAVRRKRGKDERIEFFIFDATERAQYESSLRQARAEAEELAAIVRSSPNAILRVAADGTVEQWNSGAQRMFDVSPSKAIGTSIENLIKMKNHPTWFAKHATEVDDENGFRFEAEDTGGKDLDITMARIRHSGPGDDNNNYSLIFRDISHKAKQERQLNVLVRELNHRVKNTLAVVLGLARQTLRPAIEKQPFDQFSQRVMAIARSHAILTDNYWEGAQIRDLIAIIEDEIGDGRIISQGPEVGLSADQITNLSMALHELTTNAIKYGALSVDTGRVEINWSVQTDEPGQIEFEWRERGGPAVTPPRSRGFGTQLVEQIVAAQFNGSARLEYETGGLCYRLTFPLTQ
ncbi:MAG: PAS domain S-box protein [Rhizobiales bacterium]|nr:PAS domain S-box protein [Hyphomicrobiales bacterium]